MIRREWPLGAVSAECWLLIAQPDHARISWELALAWGGTNVADLVGLADDAGHSLAEVRRELLDAILHHDDGWIGYRPLIDPESSRPLNFTEMPAATVQPLWSDSIAACRRIGPLAGWLVASHFSALQSKRDDDYPLWEAWLERVDRQRAEQLAVWRAAAADHTDEIAQCGLACLQAMDWISLWLCCRCPVAEEDRWAEPLVVGGGKTGWPDVRFTADAVSTAPWERRVRVTPWPFAADELRLTASARSVPVGARSHANEPNGSATSGRPAELVWRLTP